ncbi:hypothetical protein [Aegicerativicinus sediminis]|uniref:hypothetical protein n=1 Tax=Aegicerativicinus sediminis TaxID=2893202 RepID=UPI001E492081|nr:hypothetical protein [Aegicerativicinus sediminis]
MVKIFRNIRLNQLRVNSTSKYILYALGEILLVVIGILIALRVNNWNEERKIAKEIDKLVGDIEEYTSSMFSNSNKLYSTLESFDSISKKVIDGTINSNDTTDIQSLERLMFQELTSYPYGTIDGNFFRGTSVTNLLDRKQDLSGPYWDLIYSLETLVQSSNEFEKFSEEINEIAQKNLDAFLGKPERIDKGYLKQTILNLLEDPSFITRMRQLHLLNEDMMFSANNTMGNIVELNIKIKVLQNNIKGNETIEFAEGFGFSPMLNIGCDNGQFKADSNQRYFILIYNSKYDRIKIKVPNRNAPEISIRKNVVRHIFLNKGDRIEVEIPNECPTTYECTGRNVLVY